MKKTNKNAIALIITMMFIIAITISIGIGLKYINSAQKSLKKEKFLIQTNIIIEDILNILKTSKELDLIKSEKELFIFLSKTSFVPIKYRDIKIILELSSARSKFNPNALYNPKFAKINKQRVLILKRYFSKNMVNEAYIDILLDGMRGIKAGNIYHSDIFNEKPDLFRDYIVSIEHLKEYNEFYTNYFYDNSLSKIKFDEIFYFTKDRNISIDLNHATAEVWKMMLGVDNEKANKLVSNAGTYTEKNPPNLNNTQKKILSFFNTSYYEPYIDVKLEIIQDKFSAKISFEYNIVKRKGYNFHYEI